MGLFDFHLLPWTGVCSLLQLDCIGLLFEDALSYVI